MTILGMQTDTQHLYFPGYFSPRDVNLDGSCSVWPTSTNADKMPVNGHYYNGNLAMPFPDPFLGYKDSFKHVMLQHEAIFKSQVHELHRLYNKQKELTAEMKRIDLHLDNSASSQLFPEASFENNKNKSIHWLNPTHDQSFVSLVEKNQCDIDYVQGNTMLSSSSFARADCDSKESILFEAKCKRIGKKILDLELPAYEYIDSDSEESPAKEMDLSKVPSDHVKSSDEKAKCFVNLNEPVKLEETESEETQHLEIPVTVNSQLQVEAPVVEKRKTTGDPEFSFSSSRKDNGDLHKIPKIVQALPCSKSSLLLRGGCKRRSNHYAGDNSCNQMDLNFSRHSPSDVGKTSKELDLDSSSTPDSKDKLNVTNLETTSRPDEKSSGSKFVIDLNLSIDEDESSLTETELRPSESSENKEQHPCKGDSDVENVKPEEDPVTMAAEAIVSIASSEAQKGDSLYWFAKIASSVVDDPESGFGLVLSCKNEDQCGEIDYCCDANNIQVARARRGRRRRASFEGRTLLDWGNITRRPRGQRCSARLIMGKV